MITLEFTRPNTTGLADECLALVRPVVRQVNADLVLDLLARMRAKISGSGRTGRIYERPGGRIHQASAPGEAPARDFGNYLDSWKPVVEEDEDSTTIGIDSAMFGTEGDPGIGMYLEYGTENMKPRPHAGPVVEEWEAEVQRKLDRIDEIPYRVNPGAGRFIDTGGRFASLRSVMDAVNRALGG